jgi:hypothetical protein
MTDLRADLINLITTHIQAHPRSLQKLIGPSEIGTPCQRKLAHKIAGTPPSNHTQATPWKPTIGTAMHTWLEDAFNHLHADQPGGRYDTETRLRVGDIDGTPIHGSSDLFDHHTGTVVDWKITTRNKIRSQYKPHGPGQQYRIQAHLYGQGWANAGYHVNNVAIMFLTRDGELADHHLWVEEYDPQIAADALARATTTKQIIDALGTTAFSVLPPTADHCPWCPFWQPGTTDLVGACPGDPAETRLDPMQDLIYTGETRTP